ncbi:hypothetical protein [Arcobacter sp. YIC-310]|uniref:hypothetical protein n=1 Tax=Arcobacter sp. YIC-310 TaxID=3376632 RepID=UPI003C18A809
MNIAKVNKSQILKTVETSNFIEGYKKTSMKTKVKARVLMKKHNIKVSTLK